MDELASHVFRSQPPVITLGGYTSPRLVVKPLSKPPKAKNIEEDSFLFPLQSILVGRTEQTAPLGVIPEGIGKSQKLPTFSVLLKELMKASQVNFHSSKNSSDEVFKSELKAGDLLSSRSALLPPAAPALLSRSASRISGLASSRPLSAATVSTKRPQSAVQTARSIRAALVRSETSGRRSQDSPPAETQRVRSEYALKSSQLTWDTSHKVMKFERGTERRFVTAEGETKTMSLEELIKEVEPIPLKIAKYNGDYRGGKRDGHGWAEFVNGDTYEGDWVKDIRQGRGTYTYKAFGAVYSGDIQRNMKHGRGQLTLRNGDMIYGEFVENSMIDSHVTIDYYQGGHYDGLMKEGKRHGNGTMEYAEHTRYEGEWKDDRRSGLGYIKFLGGFFEGAFIRDNVDGKGILVYESTLPVSRHSTPMTTPPPKTPQKKKKQVVTGVGRKKIVVQVSKAVLLPHYIVTKSKIFGEDPDYFHFAGYRLRDSDIIWKTLLGKELQKRLGKADEEFTDGKFYRGELNGAAMVRFGRYALYYGNFKESKKHGYGHMTYTDPEHTVKWLAESEGEYEGKWENDLRHGRGTMLFANGLKYEGNFRCDNRHNVIGTLFFPDGNVYTGNWVDNMMQGKGQYRTAEGRVYEGNFVRGMFGAEGRLLFPTGEYYEGEVSRMHPHGSGRIKYTDGSSYEGQFDMGVRSGAGTMRYANGDIYEGEWEQGVREGYGKMSYFGRGERYEGFWSDDKRNGKGALHGKHGIFIGLWNNDVKEGTGEADHRVNI